MTHAADAPQTACDPAPPQPADPGLAWELEALRAIGDIVVSAARATGRQLEAAAAAAPAEPGAGPESRATADLALALTRLARAVRLTVALHARAREGRIWPDTPKKPAGTAAAPPDPAAPGDGRGLDERRRQAQVRRAMTRFIAASAVEAGERDADEIDRLNEALDARLERERPDPLDFEHVDAKTLAFEVCAALGVDPGPDWWRESWGLETGRPGAGPDPRPEPESEPESEPEPESGRRPARAAAPP